MLFVFWLFLCENLSIDFNKKKTVVHLEGFKLICSAYMPVAARAFLNQVLMKNQIILFLVSIFLANELNISEKCFIFTRFQVCLSKGHELYGKIYTQQIQT